MQDYKFKDLVDIPALNAILTDLYDVAKIASAIIDMDGNFLTGVGWQRICMDFHRKNPQSEKLCIQSDTHIRDEIAAGEPSVIYECPHGMIDSCCPIIIDGVHLANIFTGQMLHAPPDAATIERFRRQARQFGFAEKDYLAALAEVPVFSPAEHRAILSFLSHLTSQIARMGLVNLRAIEQAEALQESERKFRSLLESTSTVPWELDLVSGKFTYMGKQIEQLLGYPADSWTDMAAWAGRLHPEDREEAVSFCQTETGQGRDHDFVYRVLHKDGSCRWIRDVVSVVLDKDKPDKLVGFMKDVTEQMEMEEEKSRIEERLKQAQKLEAVGTLAGGIAHDFNNILSIILGYTDLARLDAQPGSGLIDNLDKVSKAGLRAKDLVQQILTFSRQSNVDVVALKPQPVIKESLKLLRALIPATIKIEEYISPACENIEADPTKLHQILMNLCTNAFQAMEKDAGVLRVCLDVATDLPVILQRRQEAGESFLDLSFSDTGCGIQPADIDKIFDPFFTTKEPGKGTGMGLAVIFGIVKDFGGMITVQSEPGQGSTFHVYLPQSRKAEADIVVEEVFSQPGNERILFVDDEEMLVSLGKAMLERLGYKVCAKQKSSEALQVFLEDPEAFDLVITDHTMPGMTGVDMAKKMLAVRPDLPIILCTGYSSMVDAKIALAQGIKAFTMKPLTQAEISRLIREVLDGAG